MSLSILLLSSRLETRVEAEATAAALEKAGHHAQVASISDVSTGTEHSHRSAGQKMRSTVRSSPIARALALVMRVYVARRRLWTYFKARPAAVILFDDRRVFPDLVVRQMASRWGAATIIVPFAVSTVEADRFLRRDQQDAIVDRPPWRALKRMLARLLPNQAHSADGTRLLFYGAWDTVALALLRLLPKRPWVLGGSSPDLVCTAGADQRDYLLRGGLSAKQIRITGQPSLDGLTGRCPERTIALRVAYGLPDTPLVLCAVPQHAEHGMLDSQAHAVAIDELFATLAQSNAAVLLSLHPKSRRDDYAAPAARYGLRILDERLADVLPAADLLVGAFSSTIGWAIGLGIPAVVVDSVNSEFQLYRDVAGVRVVEGHRELAHVLADLLADPKKLVTMSAQAATSSLRVARFDGGASARVVRAIEDAVAIKRAAHGRYAYPVQPERKAAS